MPSINSTMGHPPTHKIALDLVGLGISAQLATWVYPPMLSDGQAPTLWLFCIPGGTYRGRAYYDRRIPDSEDMSYSMAEAMTRAGIGVIIIDNLGTGESPVAVDGEKLTRQVLAHAYDQTVRQIREQLVQGTLMQGIIPAITSEQLWIAGVGHSMGGFLLTQLQGTSAPCDATILLGWTQETVETPHADVRGSAGNTPISNGYVLSDARLRVATRPFFFSQDVPLSLIEADDADATTIPSALLELFVLAGTVAQEAAQIRTPLYLAFGESDVTPHPREEPRFYTASNSITVFVQPGSHHCANFEPGRFALWSGIAAWCRAQTSHPLA